MILKYNEKHKAMLQKIGYELIDLQKNGSAGLYETQ